MANNHNGFDNNGEHLVLSHDLLRLLQWLIDHEAEGLKQIIARAVGQGVSEGLHEGPEDTLEVHVADESLQHSLVGFLETLDNLLAEVKSETAHNRLVNRNRMPVLDHLDLGECGEHVLQATLDRVNERLEHNPTQNQQKLLLQELLKQWKPQKNQLCN